MFTQLIVHAIERWLLRKMLIWNGKILLTFKKALLAVNCVLRHSETWLFKRVNTKCVCVNPDLNDDALPTPTADDYDYMTSQPRTTDSYEAALSKPLCFPRSYLTLDYNGNGP